MIYRSCKIRLPNLSLICPTMLHLPTLSKHSSLFQERLGHRYITTFKYIHGLVDHNFNILRNSDIHSYNTRRRNDFRLPLAKRNYGGQWEINTFYHPNCCRHVIKALVHAVRISSYGCTWEVWRAPKKLELLEVIISSNSYASFVLSKLPACIHNSLYAR